MPQLTVLVESGPPDHVLITGEVDLATVGQIDRALAGLTGDVLVDCAGVGFIDSAGFHALDRGYEAAERRGDKYSVSGLNELARRVAALFAIPYLTAVDPVVIKQSG